MGKVKQFIFGAIAGAGVIFVALQYHVVQTLEGFRVVPRTPQHSVGLAYVDMRNWSSPDFADRPEVTRALVAAGMSDLIVGTAADDLMNSVSSDSPMGQLRGYLNESPADSQPDPLFDADDFMGIRKDADDRDNLNSEDLFTIPFDRDARKPVNAGGIVRTPNLQNTDERTTVAQRAREAMDEVFTSRNRSLDLFDEPVSDDFRRTPDTSGRTQPTVADETGMLEDMLFGGESAAPVRTTPERAESSSSNFGIFEDVTGALEDRADEALNRARQGFRNEVNRTIEDSRGAAERFTRDSISNSLPKSISSMFPEDISRPVQTGPTDELPDAIKALRDGFDPFIN